MKTEMGAREEALEAAMQRAFISDAESRTNREYVTEIFDAGAAYARGSQWVAVKSADDLPKVFNWYETTVEEAGSLGTFRYVDILYFGYSVERGNYWTNLPEDCRVIAWRERSKPYTADSGQEGE